MVYIATVLLCVPSFVYSASVTSLVYLAVFTEFVCLTSFVQLELFSLTYLDVST